MRNHLGQVNQGGGGGRARVSRKSLARGRPAARHACVRTRARALTRAACSSVLGACAAHHQASIPSGRLHAQAYSPVAHPQSPSHPPTHPPTHPTPPPPRPPKIECRLCLTLHPNEGNYLAHTQGKRHQQNLAKRAAKEASDKPAAPAPNRRVAVKKTGAGRPRAGRGARVRPPRGCVGDAARAACSGLLPQPAAGDAAARCASCARARNAARQDPACWGGGASRPRRQPPHLRPTRRARRIPSSPGRARSPLYRRCTRCLPLLMHSQDRAPWVPGDQAV